MRIIELLFSNHHIDAIISQHPELASDQYYSDDMLIEYLYRNEESSLKRINKQRESHPTWMNESWGHDNPITTLLFSVQTQEALQKIKCMREFININNMNALRYRAN